MKSYAQTILGNNKSLGTNGGYNGNSINTSKASPPMTSEIPSINPDPLATTESALKSHPQSQSQSQSDDNDDQSYPAKSSIAPPRLFDGNIQPPLQMQMVASSSHGNSTNTNTYTNNNTNTNKHESINTYSTNLNGKLNLDIRQIPSQMEMHSQSPSVSLTPTGSNRESSPSNGSNNDKNNKNNEKNNNENNINNNSDTNGNNYNTDDDGINNITIIGDATASDIAELVVQRATLRRGMIGKNKGGITITTSQRNVLMKQAKKESRLQTGNAKERRMLSIIKIVTKLAVLVTVDAIVTVLMIILAIWMPTVSLCVHSIICGFCAIYSFKIYEKQYSKMCSLCHWIAFRLCLCCLFKTINIRKEIETQIEIEMKIRNQQLQAQANANANANANTNYNDDVSESLNGQVTNTKTKTKGDESDRSDETVGVDADGKKVKAVVDNNDTNSNVNNNNNNINDDTITRTPVFKIDKSTSVVIQRFIALEQAFNLDDAYDDNSKDNDVKESDVDPVVPN